MQIPISSVRAFPERYSYCSTIGAGEGARRWSSIRRERERERERASEGSGGLCHGGFQFRGSPARREGERFASFSSSLPSYRAVGRSEPDKPNKGGERRGRRRRLYETSRARRKTQKEKELKEKRAPLSLAPFRNQPSDNRPSAGVRRPTHAQQTSRRKTELGERHKAKQSIAVPPAVVPPSVRPSVACFPFYFPIGETDDPTIHEEDDDRLLEVDPTRRE